MASSIGRQSWVLCDLDVWHTTQIGSLSFTQNSFNFSPCRSQFSFSFLTCKTASHTFFRAKLDGAPDLDTFFLHTGHSRKPVSQQCFRQLLQKLWLHCSNTGSSKISQQMGHVKSSSGSDIINHLAIKLIHRSNQCTSSGCPHWVHWWEYNFRSWAPQLNPSEYADCSSILPDMKWSMVGFPVHDFCGTK